MPELAGLDPEDTRNFKTAGDVRCGQLGQVAMAVGDGMRAAVELDKELGDAR